jgi:hypothetical protein
MQISVQIDSNACANARPDRQKTLLSPVFSDRQYRFERETVTTSKLLIGLSLTCVKAGTVYDNLEASTGDSFGLLKGAGIKR